MSLPITILGEPLLINEHGVGLDCKIFQHIGTSTATCLDGDELIVAPKIFHAEHEDDDPVLVCTDHGVHAYRFKDLVPGKQPRENGL